MMPPDAVLAVRTRGLPPRAGLALSAATTVVAMITVHMSVFAAGLSSLAAIALFLFGVGLLWVQMPRNYPHPRFGACNAVTLLRAGLGATLLTPILVVGAADNAMNGWAVALVASAALSLDGVDGWLARRSRLNSAFGARFDMEVDAALALLLSLLALAAGEVGPVVLVLGLMRYTFVAASWVVPWMAAPLPDRFGRKAVCVIQIAALIALQTPIVTGALAISIALGAALALIWSFGRDILWLWRHRT
jgi:phosphatidylglycerophosphate synthase